jgi:feruloyl esterase
MKAMQFFILLGIVSVGLNIASARAESTPANGASAQCIALQSTDFSRIPDAPIQILSAKLVKAEKSIPDYCEVRGYVAPQVGFEMQLPIAGWNGKFLEQGCPGNCGEVGMITAAVHKYLNVL